ncbi:MAG: FISUMP domain-containing protein [Candidatus Saccharimonas sp.]
MAQMVRINKFSHPAFTIVELLIVIVIIAILATITIVAYNGITDRAHESSLKSDLSNGSNLLEISQATDGTYPTDLNTINNGQAYKASGDNHPVYNTNADGTAYCLETHYPTTNPTMSFFVTDTNTSPQQGTCSGVTGVPGGTPVGGGTIADGSPIQTITSANCPATRTRAVDARDNHTYWVQKLADGKCWMLTNLAYAGSGTNTYSDAKTLSVNLAGTYTAASYYIPTGSNVTTEPTNPSTSTDGTGQYGYLYNWCAAMGVQTSTSACANATTPLPNTSISICPSGWRLPLDTGSGDFAALNTAVNGGSTTTDAGLIAAPWLGQLAGYWGSGFYISDPVSNYWSASQDSAASANGLYFDSSNIYPASNDTSKSYGYAIRCVAV